MSTVDSSNTAIDTVTEDIDKVNISDSNNDDTSVSDVQKETCAACGKEGNSEDMNTCNKCKMVKYCNAACKKKHRTKHKKACDRRVAELHEEQLFKDVERDECPLCFQPMPLEAEATTFQTCCGKMICNGCIYAMRMSEGKDLCAFCRMPPSSSDEEIIEEIHKLMNNGNGEAFNLFAFLYANGRRGMPRDWNKANELFLKAGKHGCSDGYFNLGDTYRYGREVEVDMEKAVHFYELGAIGGDSDSRHNLACLEGVAGNGQRSKKHIIISAKAGHERSLEAVKIFFMKGTYTKEEYESTLRAYHERQKEMRSDARDKAAASGMFSSG